MSEPQPLALFDRIQDPIEAVDKLGEWLARSGMFGCDKVEQGKVLALACLVERKNPIEMARKYHIIEGKLSMRADAIQAEFEADGGSVDWVKSDKEVCEVIFEHPKAKRPITIRMTLAELVENGVAIAKGGGLKANYRQRPQAMLRARCVGEGVRMIRPGIIVGIGLAEEMDDYPVNGTQKSQQTITLSAVTTQSGSTTPPPPDTPFINPKEPGNVKVVDAKPITADPDAYSKEVAKTQPSWAAPISQEKPAPKRTYKPSKAMEKAEAEKAAKQEVPTEEKQVEELCNRIETVAAESAKNSTPAPAPDSAQQQKELSADDEHLILAELFQGKDFEVNSWLAAQNWILPLQNWRDMRPDQRAKVLARPSAFMRAVQQLAEQKKSS